MKKFLKGLRYFLCYVAITLSTAVGVVVYQSNSAGSVSNGNLAGSTVGQVENNLMEVVTNLMDLESFNVNSSVSLTDTTKPSSTPIDIDFNIDINLGAGFSSIEANGIFDISLDNETFDVAIRFVDNTFYVSALDQDIQFTASGLIEGIGGGIVVCGAFLLAMWQGFDNSSAAKIFCYTTVIILYTMSIWLSMQALNWKIIIDEEALIFTNFLRITRKYRYSNFTHIYVCHNRNNKIEKYILFVGKKRITVEGIVENFDNFEKLLKKRLKKEKLQPKFEIKYSRF